MYALLNLCLATLVVLGFAVTQVKADATTSPGKNSAYTSVEGVTMPPVAVVVAAATIEKAKKKTVVEIDGFANDNGSFVVLGGYLELAPRVNGFEDVVQVTNDFSTYDVSKAVVTCAPFVECSTAGQWWVDIDAAETAHPGLFVNQPLLVELQGGGSNANANVSLRVHVQKK